MANFSRRRRHFHLSAVIDTFGLSSGPKPSENSITLPSGTDLPKAAHQPAWWEGREVRLKAESRASASVFVNRRTFDIYAYPRNGAGDHLADRDNPGEGGDSTHPVYVMFQYDPAGRPEERIV